MSFASAVSSSTRSSTETGSAPSSRSLPFTKNPIAPASATPEVIRAAPNRGDQGHAPFGQSTIAT